MNDEPTKAPELELEDVDDRESPLPDDFMTGSEQWWEFLDKKGSSEMGTAESDLEVQDNAPPRHSGTGLRPTSHSFRCSNCRGENPSDFPFCVHCGSPPRQPLNRRTDLFVIERPVDEDARDYVARIFAAGGSRLDTDAIDALLEHPPAFLLVDGYPRQLNSLLERLDEVGVDVRTLSPTDPALPWHREIAESILRDQTEAVIFGLLLLGTLAATFLLTPILFPLGAVILWWRFRKQRRWYQDEFRLQMTPMLAAVSGLGPDLADRTRRLLQRLDGTDARDSLSACLMEYYAIWHRLAPTPNSVRSRLHRQARTLARQVIDQVIRCGEDYADVHSVLARHSGPLDDPDDAHLAKLTRAERKLRSQLATMANSLESLRARTVSVDTNPDQTGATLSEVMGAIEDELEVVGETVAALESDVR